MATENEIDPVIQRVMGELSQGPATRRHLFEKIEKALDRPVIALFTSFRHKVMIEDSDADMLDGMLQPLNLTKGLAVIISSPGGRGEAAERIINTLRSYSGTGEFVAIVPGKAKSAATMICLGASKILMGSASELGPVDPQIPIWDDNFRWDISAFHVVDTYDTLFQDATKAKGNLQPYIQQLGRYHASIVDHLRSSIDLSKDISIKALQIGMMAGKSDDEIEEQIKMLLTPEGTKTHGRPIFRDLAREIGLNIENVEHKSDLWKSLYELYIRLKFLADSPTVSKVIESKESNFLYPAPKEVATHE